MKLDFYDVDKNYIEFLQNAEFDARGYTCVPNMEYGNRNQKFLCGIVLKVGQFNYYVPVTSYKKQQSENILIKFEKDKKNPIKGSLRFNYMIPVPDEFIHVRKINAEPKLERRIFLAKQLRYIISEIYDRLNLKIQELEMRESRGERISAVEYDDLIQLRGLMKDISVGGDSYIWNGKTTIQTNNKVVALDTSGFSEGNEKLKKIQYFNVLTWVWEQASQNRDERCIIVADEAYMMIDQRVPTALIHMRNMAKRGRKYNVSIMTISHSAVDFLAPPIKQYGQELLGTSCYKLFFGCEGQNLVELSNLYGLKEAERDFLLSAEQGYALAQFGSKRVIVHFKVGDYKKNRISGGGEGVESNKDTAKDEANFTWTSVNA